MPMMGRAQRIDWAYSSALKAAGKSDLANRESSYLASQQTNPPANKKTQPIRYSHQPVFLHIDPPLYFRA
jgi:hypothetical protein